MSNTEIDLLRKDECQPLTQAQMENIKSQFHPSNTANVNVKPYTIYSPNEQVVGEWQETVDGVLKKKPVYEIKTPYFAIASGSVEDANLYNTSSLSIDIPISMECHTKNESHLSTAPFITGIAPNYSLGLRFTRNGILQNTGQDRSAYGSIQAILRYTKTSDEWEEV